MARKAAQFLYPFRRVVVTVNNVNDVRHARRLAAEAVERGELAEVVFVADALPRALEVCGLRKSDLGRVQHFINFHLVTVTATDCEYLLHVGAEVELRRPFDWISDAVRRLEAQPKYLVANPSWDQGTILPKDEAVGWDDPYYLGDAFSDQIFLAKRRLLAAPVYSYPDITGRWYPMAEVGAIFEKRVHHFMANCGYFRLTDSRIAYEHKGVCGQYYPKPSLWCRARRKAGRMLTFISPVRTSGSA
jgi:hypothetical protein